MGTENKSKLIDVEFRVLSSLHNRPHYSSRIAADMKQMKKIIKISGTKIDTNRVPSKGN